MDRELRVRFVLLGGLFVALIATSLLLVSFYGHTADVRTLIIPAEVGACKADEDCGVTNQIGCCPCEAGGGQGGVNKRMRERLKTFLHRACQEGVPCVAVAACRDDLRAVCRNKRCTIRGPETEDHG